ncbi:hypothetical protein HFQ13_13995 [Acidithiobacillus sp. VAN18-1]|uniref:Lipoyl-binding domain-containing protein n=1 Tax=Igneacidithiobacillus copahuensis TaxID=2724909 RepID=A0AAE2YSC6_9PROT|nr:lipoyl domain-containing protein [Igneacidithiobacillus copahuensis]MBU2789297.1 hypothetical protein [Igneacidithiobacillus copahuensis]MBU2795429.1 hypothetical protein [Acidithiobacillus sp. VAN18-2]
MKQEVIMPVLSDTMQTGRLVRWNKAVGDAVKKGGRFEKLPTSSKI